MVSRELNSRVAAVALVLKSDAWPWSVMVPDTVAHAHLPTVVLAAQSRKEQGLPTYIVTGDLYRGYDVIWRDAVLVHLGAVGVAGEAAMKVAVSASRRLMLRRRWGPQ